MERKAGESTARTKGGGRTAGGGGAPRAIKKMKVTLDHIGIAVKDLQAALAFYRDALGLEIEAPEEVPSQHVRAHFIPVGEARHRGGGAPGVRLELLEATSAESPTAQVTNQPGPVPHRNP